MTVRELLTKLQDYDPDAIVLVLRDSGDYEYEAIREADLLAGFASDKAYTNPHDWGFDPRGCPDSDYRPAVLFMEKEY